MSPTCRGCKNRRRAVRGRQRRGDDGLEDGVEETRRKINEAFRARDPDGSETRQLHRHVQSIVRRFNRLPHDLKAKATAWFMTEFLRPGEGARR